MEAKFIIKARRNTKYFLAIGRGMTSDRSEAYTFTIDELKEHDFFNKYRRSLWTKRLVLIPVTQ